MNQLSRPPTFLAFLTAAALLALTGVGLFAGQDATKKQPAPQRWEKQIAAFETEDRADPPPKNAILFLGSSSIRLWDLDKSFPDHKTINRGFGGSTLADSIHFFDRLVVPHAPAAIVVYAGDNDVSNGMKAKAVMADFTKLAGLVAEKLPGTPVIYIAIKPSVSRWGLWPAMKEANDGIAAWCDRHEGFYFADTAAAMLADAKNGEPPAATWFAKDGLHLNADGYAGWKNVIVPLLNRALKDQ